MEKEGGDVELWDSKGKRKGNMQREERRAKIESSKYNRWYKKIKKEGISEYLRKG